MYIFVVYIDVFPSPSLFQFCYYTFEVLKLAHSSIVGSIVGGVDSGLLSISSVKNVDFLLSLNSITPENLYFKLNNFTIIIIS